MHIKGFLTRFSKTAKTQAEFLNRVAKLNVPLVGVDPAIVLSYRDEYKEALGDSRGDFHVLTAHEWLTNQLDSITLQSAVKNIAKSDRTFEWHLFPHCICLLYTSNITDTINRIDNALCISFLFKLLNH